MLQAVGFIMHLIPCIPKFFIQEGFQETVMADDLQRNSLTFGRKRYTVMLLIIDKGGDPKLPAAGSSRLPRRGLRPSAQRLHL